jgi:hypothetical protein
VYALKGHETSKFDHFPEFRKVLHRILDLLQPSPNSVGLVHDFEKRVTHRVFEQEVVGHRDGNRTAPIEKAIGSSSAAISAFREISTLSRSPLVELRCLFVKLERIIEVDGFRFPTFFCSLVVWPR